MTRRPALYIASSFGFGIYAGSLIDIPIIVSLSVSSLFLAVSLAFLKRSVPSAIALYLSLVFAGISAYQNTALPSNNSLPTDHISRIATSERHRVILRGVVTDDPVWRDTQYGKKRTSFVLKVEAYKDSAPWQRACGLVSANVYSERPAHVSYADEVELEGYLSTPRAVSNPGVFDYSKYLRTRGITARLSVGQELPVRIVGKKRGNAVIASAYAARKRIGHLIDRQISMPYSGFIKALLIGDRSGLGWDISDDFVKTGTVHVIAVSGLQVGLVAWMGLALFGLVRIPRKAGMALTLTLLVYYAFIAGLNPPIVRAVVMFAVFAAGYVFEKDQDALNSLGLAAFLILLFDPAALFGPSFQLSFASIASTLLLVPKINAILGALHGAGQRSAPKAAVYVLNGAVVSLAAFIGVWPIVAHYFNIVPFVSILANLAAVPALFLVAFESMLMVLAGMFFGAIAGPLAWLNTLTQQGIFHANSVLSDLPFAYIRIASPGSAEILSYYAMLFIVMTPDSVWSNVRFFNKRRAVISVLLILNVIVWSGIVSRLNRPTGLSFIDVGQGDSCLVRLPQGRNVLIDAGPASDDGRYDAARAIIAPYLWNSGISAIDLLVITHPHADHAGGASYILDNFSVGYLLDSGNFARKNRCKNLKAIRNDSIHGFSGTVIYVLNPAVSEPSGKIDANDDSLVLRIVHDNFSAIFCGDITSAAMRQIVESGHEIDAHVMKVPHHGSGLGDQDIVIEFFKKVSPKISVISTGRLPGERGYHDKISGILTSLGSECYATSSDGEIDIDYSRGKYSVKTHSAKNN